MLLPSTSSYFRFLLLAPLFLLVLLGLSACSSEEKKSDTPEGAYALAQEFEKDERYEEAIRRYNEVKTKFPYSKYSVMSELAVADCYFKQESYLEAQVAYQAFKELHPKHPQIDYVTFRLGLSFYEQLPETVDRDLTLASSAILYFEEVIRQYPQSQHLKEAEEKRTSALKKLAGKEAYIAEFYFKRKDFESALPRFEGLLKKYPGLGFDEESLAAAAISAMKVGEPERARRYKKELLRQFPNSAKRSTVEQEVRE